MLEAEDRKIIEDELVKLRSHGYDGLTRGCWYDPEKKIVFSHFGTYCTAPIATNNGWGDNNLAFAYVFNGGKQEGQHSNPKGKLVGDEISKRYLEFLLDKEISPCRDVVAHIENADDTEWINEEGGFIITNYTDLNAGELCFFLITQRFCQEQYRSGGQWFKFVERGIDPRIAFVMAHSFTWKGEKGKEIVGYCGAPGHAGFHDLPEWWAKNYYNSDWCGVQYLVGTHDVKRGYGSNVGLGRPGQAIGVRNHPMYDEYGWDKPEGYGFFGVTPGVSWQELLEKITLEVNPPPPPVIEEPAPEVVVKPKRVRKKKEVQIDS